jgi:hypothetical protein
MNELKKTRSEAMAALDMYYFTGKECKHGHISKRYTTNGICYECNKQSTKNKQRDFAMRLKAHRSTQAQA